MDNLYAPLPILPSAASLASATGHAGGFLNAVRHEVILQQKAATTAGSAVLC
jgi:hypothetical protein